MLLSHSHPLRGHKLTSYLVFKEVVLMINNGKHLTPKKYTIFLSFLQILELCYFTNHTTLKYKIEDFNIKSKILI